MSEPVLEPHPFIAYLESLGENRAALAALRRGLGQPPGSVPDMYPYVIRFLPEGAAPWVEETCYLLASLYAIYPQSAASGNMGSHYAQARNIVGDDAAIERRFTALLSAHPDDLHFYLRQAISFLRSKEAPVNWQQLYRDLLAWDHPSRYVQKRWADAFWGR